ncbi:MAG: hypothetical protein EXR77_13920 [Myxococcales bacterium]|nr:hypothetical protein [Myxococcales bacterium]
MSVPAPPPAPASPPDPVPTVRTPSGSMPAVQHSAGARGSVMTPMGLRAVSLAPSDGLHERDLVHPSAMVAQLGWLARWFAWVFFKPVQFTPRLANEINALNKQGGGLVYVLSTISLLDYFYFNWAYLQHGLPLARFANGVSMRWLQPVRKVIAAGLRRLFGRSTSKSEDEVLHGLLRRRQPVVLFLRRGFSLLDFLNPKPQMAYLRELVEVQKTIEFPLIVMPQVLIWERDPDRGRHSIIDEFFGDPSAPGRLRKLLSFVLNHRRAHVRMGEPIDLTDFFHNNAATTDDMMLAERLRSDIVRALQQEDRVIRGAPIRPPEQVRREILAEPEVIADLNRLAAQTGRSVDEVRAEADSNIEEIAAKFAMPMLAFLSFVLTLLWARIYDGIEVDEEGLDRLRLAGRKAPLIIVPSHKSHIDYLIISYLFYRNGLIPPHIAAGANLSFFPLGWIFRRAGAFFLRRSFSGQPIYAAAFRHYVRKLLSDGHWIEFFPEGTRSRTGKLLPPKFGLIKLVLELVADGKRDDVLFVPTNFGYERLIEEKAYRKELEGGEKVAESPVEVLKATEILVHKYGRIRIQFGDPMSVRQVLEEFGAMGIDGQRDAASFDRALKVCGWRILGGINKAAVLTPTALVAAVLLSKTHKGIARDDLLLRVGYLLDVAIHRGAVLSEPIVTAIQVQRQQILEAEQQDLARQAQSGGQPDPFGHLSQRARAMGHAVREVVDHALSLFTASKWILRRKFDSEEVLIVRSEGRMHLDYYKNNMLHLFVADALLAAAILSLLERAPIIAADILQLQTKFLSRLLKFEFVYEPGLSFEDQYARTLADFLQAGWLVRRGDGSLVVATTVRGALRLYAKLLQNFVESYALVARTIGHLKQGPLSESAFVDHTQRVAQMAFDLGTIECYEAMSKSNLGNALRIFIEEGFIIEKTEVIGKKKVKSLSATNDPAVADKFADFFSRMHELQAPWTLERL